MPRHSAWRAPISILAAICASLAGFSFARDSVERGLDAFRRRDFKTAEIEFARAVNEEARSAQAWKLLGMTYIEEEKYEAAEVSCRKACDLDSREENACYYLGQVAYMLGRFDESLNAYHKALANGGDHGRVLLGLAQTFRRACRQNQPGQKSLHYDASNLAWHPAQQK